VLFLYNAVVLLSSTLIQPLAYAVNTPLAP
jgi:hypothetical protein